MAFRRGTQKTEVPPLLLILTWIIIVSKQRKRRMGVALEDYGVAIAVVLKKYFSWLFENQSRYHQAAQFLSKEKEL